MIATAIHQLCCPGIVCLISDDGFVHLVGYIDVMTGLCSQFNQRYEIQKSRIASSLDLSFYQILKLPTMTSLNLKKK